MSPSSAAIRYPLYRRADSSERGRHLVATTAIPKGRLIFAERPLVALQSLDNQQEVKVCHCCKAFVGGPDFALVKRFRTVTDVDKDTNDDDDNCDEALLAHAEDDRQKEDYCVVPCRYKCGHLYCSTECEQDAWQSFHQDLCTGQCLSAEDPIVQFKQYAAETNEILLMVAEWWVAQHRCACEEYRQRYTDFSMPYWWDVAVTNDIMDQVGGFAEGILVQESLREICERGADLLNRALQDIPPITAADISKWIGACEQNSMGIRQRHPLCRSVLEDADVRQRRHNEIVRCLAEAGFIGDDNEEEGADEDEDEIDIDNDEDAKDETEGNAGESEWKHNIIEQDASDDDDDDDNTTNENDDSVEWHYTPEEIEKYLADKLFIDEDNSVRDAAVSEGRFRDTVGDDLDYIFPPLDGTAMYFTACKMNHSCDPNVIVLYKGRGWGKKHPLTAYCIAYKDIEEGEELTISYIENDDPLEKRKSDLANYGFTCTCPKCEAQTNGQTLESGEKQPADGMDDIFGGDGEETDEETDKAEPTETLSLQQKVNRLDSAVNHSRFANVPIHLQGKVAAYVLEIGKESSNIKEEAILNLWHHCQTGMRERDFCLCKIGGCDLEEHLYGMLQRNGEWPSTSYRAMYWCAALSAAVGLSHEGSFIDALGYMDKALILGLPRKNDLLIDFFSYVEQHGKEMATGPYTPRRLTSLPSFSLGEDREFLQTQCLSSPIQYPVAERPFTISLEDFSKDFVSKAVPVVIRGYASDWRSTKVWRNLEKFGAEHGHRVVPIEVGSMLEGRMKEQVVTLRSFVHEFLAKGEEKLQWSLGDSIANTSRIAYMAQHPLGDQVLSLQDDIDISPKLCGPGGPSHIYYWIGTGGTRTPLHFDSYENLFVQTVGAKYIRLYEADETPNLYVTKSGYGLQGNMSDVDCENEDFSKHPKAKNAKYQEVLLYPGDALYIPCRTWHYVRSLTSSVSVNYWF